MNLSEKTVFHIQASAAKRKFVSFERGLFSWLIATGDYIKGLDSIFTFILAVDN